MLLFHPLCWLSSESCMIWDGRNTFISCEAQFLQALHLTMLSMILGCQDKYFLDNWGWKWKSFTSAERTVTRDWLNFFFFNTCIFFLLKYCWFTMFRVCIKKKIDLTWCEFYFRCRFQTLILKLDAVSFVGCVSLLRL